jgi:3-hydroxyisobutyrate dehydrogenase
VTFGEAVGLDKAKVLDILATGAGDSGVLNAKKEKVAKEDFSVQFQSALIYKDLHYLEGLAFDLKRPLFTGSTVKELYGMTLSQGRGDARLLGLILGLEEILSLPVFISETFKYLP